MKSKFCLLLVLFCNAMPSIPLDQPEEEAPLVIDDIDRMLNLDKLEEEMIQTNVLEVIEVKPPHPFIIWLRIVGLPIANAYFSARKVVRLSWHWVLDHLGKKTDSVSREDHA